MAKKKKASPKAATKTMKKKAAPVAKAKPAGVKKAGKAAATKAAKKPAAKVVGKKVVAKTKGPRASKVAAKTVSASPTKKFTNIHSFELYGTGSAARIPEAQGPRFYCVVESSTASDLALNVQNKINEGWTPSGGISHSGGLVVQALVRY